MVKYNKIYPLQEVVSSDKQWEEMLQRPQLIVIDVFSEWSGPCRAMIPVLRRMLHQIGDDKLHLAMAKADNVSVLQKFKNRSLPTWMFCQNGKIINILFGANGPTLMHTILSELNIDAEVREENAEKSAVELVSDMCPISEDASLKTSAPKTPLVLESDSKETIGRKKEDDVKTEYNYMPFRPFYR